MAFHDGSSSYHSSPRNYQVNSEWHRPPGSQACGDQGRGQFEWRYEDLGREQLNNDFVRVSAFF